MYSFLAPERYQDEVAEWLRRWTANPLCSARVGSNPILVDNFYFISLFFSHSKTSNFLRKVFVYSFQQRLHLQKLF